MGKQTNGNTDQLESDAEQPVKVDVNLEKVATDSQKEQPPVQEEKKQEPEAQAPVVPVAAPV